MMDGVDEMDTMDKDDGRDKYCLANFLRAAALFLDRNEIAEDKIFPAITVAMMIVAVNHGTVENAFDVVARSLRAGNTDCLRPWMINDVQTKSMADRLGIKA